MLNGTFDLLDYLKDRYKLHIIANGFDEVQQGKLEKSKINHYFETVTNLEIVDVKKHVLKFSVFALNLVNIIAEKSVMIGDNYEVDVLSAVNIGVESAFLDVNNTDIEGDFKK